MSIPRQWALLVTCIVALCGLGVWYILVEPDIKYENILKRYPKGTPAETILHDYGGRVVLLRSGTFAALDRPPTEDDKRRYSWYYVRLSGDNAEIYFNYYREVIKVVKLNDRISE